MIDPATWSCEWCGKTKKTSWFFSLFTFLKPRFCPVEGHQAGWEHPACRLSHALAMRIAERAAMNVYLQSMGENKGKSLGDLRGHDLVQDINHNEKSIYSGTRRPT